MRKHFKQFFNLVLRNYQGQVAIFVALIFQIVFILFALMINVGLLIHHKINLQQSTDLAAYYGAMKQAEMMNVVAHVNFQIRQAYKLMAWRYRVLGTFGMQTASQNPDPNSNANNAKYPIYHTQQPLPNAFKYNPQSENSTCTVDNAQISPLEMPFMCMNHYGFKEILAQGQKNDETLCKADCAQYRGISIPVLGPGTAPSGGSGVYGEDILATLKNAINRANANFVSACRATGPITITQLSKFYFSYLQDVKNRMLFIKMMMANLSAGETEMLDLEGNPVLTGVKNTFTNNLTEANNSSLTQDRQNIFETYNSLSAARNSPCAYEGTNQSPNDSGSATLFAEINFRFIQYFIMRCQLTNESSNNPPIEFKPGSIYNANVTDLNEKLKEQITKTFNDGGVMANKIKNIMLQNNHYEHTIGIEKNPWCSVYYGVKATTTPIIPFLPISKITLSAFSFAKPFGGSIGPRQYRSWPASAKKSDATGGRPTQTDITLPIQNPTGADIDSLKENINVLLNYSTYVGDQKGLSDAKVIATYHDMLLNRSVTNNGSTVSSQSKKIEPTAGRDIEKQPNSQNIYAPEVWPSLTEWDHITDRLDNPKYDPLAYNTTDNQNSFMRDIELSVVAPNQFETTYYSIEPDFYNVYLKNKLENPQLLATLMQRLTTSSGTKVYPPKDFGFFQTGETPLTGVGKEFSVKNQLEVVQHIMRVSGTSSPPTLTPYNFNGANSHHALEIERIKPMYFTYVPYLPGSLLTSWTMKDLVSDDFAQIPLDETETKTPFAKCADVDLQGANGYGSIVDTPDPRGGTEKLPASPGNCITGGRSGYSVKIVSPEGLLKETVDGVTDSILNPPTGFIIF